MNFTLDTNCVIAAEGGGEDAPSIRALATAHLNGAADVAVVVVMASEWRTTDFPAADISSFENRLRRAGLAKLGRCYPACYWGITYWDNCLWADDGPLEEELHNVLFPYVEFSLQEFCEKHGLDIPDEDQPIRKEYRRWFNAKCDVLAIWSHINAGRDVFVTRDHSFHKLTKKPRLLALGARAIVRPAEAVSLLA